MKKALVFLLFIKTIVLVGPSEPMNNSPGILTVSQGDMLVAQIALDIEVAQLNPAYLLLEVAQSATLVEVAQNLITNEAHAEVILPINQNSVPLNQLISSNRTQDSMWTTPSDINCRYTVIGPPRTTPGSPPAQANS